jgi:hypothetical protein
MKIWIPLIFFALTISCAKHDPSKEEENQHSSIIEALNQEDHELALSLIRSSLKNNPDDLELQYLKAQAYSLKANIDIYALFPVVKMKLFDVAIDEWSDMDKFEKRNKDKNNLTAFGEGDISQIEYLENVHKKEIEEIKVEDIKFTVEVENAYNYTYTDFDGNKNVPVVSCSSYIIFESSLFLKGKKHTMYSNKTYPLIAAKSAEDTCEENSKLTLNEYREEDNLVWKRTIKYYALLFLEEKINKLKERKNSERYIKAALALFDSIPIIRNIPDINNENSDHIFTALTILENLRIKLGQNTRIGKNSRQHMSLLSGFLILGSLKDSLYLDKINEPGDIMCQSKPEVLVSHYPHFLYGARYLLNATLGTEFTKKNQENYNKVKKEVNSAPEKLTDEQQRDLIQDLHNFIDSSC